jgi:hypothetical protein
LQCVLTLPLCGCVLCALSCVLLLQTCGVRKLRTAAAAVMRQTKQRVLTHCWWSHCLHSTAGTCANAAEQAGLAGLLPCLEAIELCAVAAEAAILRQLCCKGGNCWIGVSVVAYDHSWPSVAQMGLRCRVLFLSLVCVEVAENLRVQG